MRSVFAAAIGRIVLVTAFLSIALGSVQGHAQQNSGIYGTYLGVDSAEGITLHLSPGGQGYQASIVAQSGGRAQIDARPTGAGAVGELRLRGIPGLVSFNPQAIGLAMVWAPLDANGSPRTNEAIVYSFRRDGLTPPPLPPGYVNPPGLGAERADAIDFLHSYEFWDAEAASRAYELIDDKFRVIMSTFPALHGDVLWKLCKAPLPSFQLGEALRGQGVTCAELDSKLKASQLTGGFAHFKQRLYHERSDALLAVECARGIHTARICMEAANKTQEAATSMDTIASILQGL